VVLFDFMNLDYRWGNTLLGLFQVVTGHDHEFPIGCVVAAGPNALPAISSLTAGAMAGSFPTSQPPSSAASRWRSSAAARSVDPAFPGASPAVQFSSGRGQPGRTVTRWGSV
jgi:hypothetical protein